MSETSSAQQGKAASDGHTDATQQSHQIATTTRTPSLMVAALGGIVVAAALTLTVSNTTTSQGIAGQSTLMQVAASEIDDAIKTVTPNVAAALAEQAKSCRAPLASALLTNAPGAAPSTVRLRSGTYLSPPFTLTDVPQRIAFPFPAPYEVGRGILSVEGAANGTTIAIFPTLTVNSTTSSYIINLWWRVKKSC